MKERLIFERTSSSFNTLVDIASKKGTASQMIKVPSTLVLFPWHKLDDSQANDLLAQTRPWPKASPTYFKIVKDTRFIVISQKKFILERTTTIKVKQERLKISETKSIVCLRTLSQH